MSELLYSVKEIFTKLLEENNCKYYNIPDYQRGYKWGHSQVEKLLDDIDKFKEDKKNNKFYCMQTLTIIEEDKNQNKKYFNVIDGQQRLTTLVVLLSYFRKKDLIKDKDLNFKDKLEYSIREKTAKFIKQYIENNGIINYEDDSWNTFLDKNMSEDYDHQDIYYLFSAYKTIKNWFEKKQIDKENFTNKLCNNVKFIINNIKEKGKERELFTNLNTGKVSLDGADLIRALIITNASKEKINLYDFSNLKDVIQLNEYRVRIGLEIDEISKWWNQENVKKYFSFANDNTENSEATTIKFDDKKYPIDLLYKLYALEKNEKTITLDFFEKSENYVNLYNDICLLHRTMVDWYNDCEIYHLVKYILTYPKPNSKKEFKFKDLIKEWKDKNREDFKNCLRDKVKTIIETKEEDDDDIYKNIEDLSYDWFYEKKLKKILILLDIIQIIDSNKKSENPTKFLKADFFKVNNEDIEHIFPQTPISISKDKDSKELSEYEELFSTWSEKDEIKDKIESLKSTNKKDEKEKIQKEINDILKNKIAINSIGNLCILKGFVNRSYGNDFYTIKRQKIIKNMKEGNFIRQHTMNCFDKGFINDPNIDRAKLVSWDNHDIDENCKYISNKIEKFFSEVKNNESK